MVYNNSERQVPSSVAAPTAPPVPAPVTASAGASPAPPPTTAQSKKGKKDGKRAERRQGKRAEETQGEYIGKLFLISGAGVAFVFAALHALLIVFYRPYVNVLEAKDNPFLHFYSLTYLAGLLLIAVLALAFSKTRKRFFHWTLLTCELLYFFAVTAIAFFVLENFGLLKIILCLAAPQLLVAINLLIGIVLKLKTLGKANA